MIKQTTTTRTRSLMLMLVAFILLFPTAIVAQTPNEQQARRFFDQTYNMVFGKQGSSLHYDVNLIGVFKTSGDIWYKDNKSKFVDERYNVWNDGKTYYRVERKKKTVTLYDANSEKKDKYANDFKFSPEDYTYHIADDPKGYLITLKLKPGRKGMKLVKILLDKKNRAPINLRIKVAFFWAHVNISKFKSGDISDDIFVFPLKTYADYDCIDKRGEG